MHTRYTPATLVSLLACTLLGAAARAADFPDPPGGWTYKYNGDQLIVGAENSGWASLDGTWTHDNGSDSYDGSVIGGTFSTGGFGIGNGPGGTSLGTNQQGVTYLRLQDTGDPRDYGYPDPSNRKVYFGHNVGSDIDPTKALTIMDSGVTLTFRARVPTLAKAGPPLDQLHRDTQQAAGVQAYPTNGDGYVTSDGGKGNFVIRQGGNVAAGGSVPAGAIAFSFTQTTDTTGGNPATSPAGFAGLTFNEFNGNVPTDQVNFGMGTKTNVVAFDPTEWHELYIVLRKDPANIGTHEAFIFRDGNLVPIVYKMTAGTGADMNDSFLAMGGSATPQNWALDVDWFGYKDEAIFPPGALLPPSLFGFAPVNQAMFQPAANGLKFSASALMPTNRLPASGFKVTLNGQDVSSQLVLTGTDTSASRTATYSGLQPNVAYTSTIIVTDSGGLSSTNDLKFDTFVEATAVIVEAEDYNHSNGQFIDNPSPNGYAGQIGTPGVDFVDTGTAAATVYRTADPVGLAATADLARSNFVSLAATDFQVGTITSPEWLNYTRTWAGPTYRAWVRMASTAAQGVRLDRVTGDRGQSNQTVQLLGTFAAPRTGTLSLFDYVALTDIQGRPIVLPLSGVNTLRLSAPSANSDLVFNYLLLQPSTAATEPLVSTAPLPGAVNVPGNTTIEATIFDGSSPVSQTTVKLKVDGTEVPAVVSKTGTVTAVKYTPTVVLAPNRTYNLNLSFSDGTARSLDWTITTANYPVLTAGMRVTNATTAGFVWRMHQNEANTDTTIAKAENALSGALGLPNLANPAAQGPASAPGTPTNPGNGTMTFTVPTVVNVSQAAGTSWGAFTPDEQMPGIPGTTSSTDGIAVEIKTFIELPRGYITLGVNSDDGFRTTAGYLNNTPLVLAAVDAGRSATDTLFSFGVEEAGVYAFRTVYFEGGGDASVEWFLVRPDGSKVLINDTASGGPRAYQQGTVPNAPANITITAQLNPSGQVVLSWSSGTLQSADLVNGSYGAVNGATSPWTVDPKSAQQKFYRVLAP